MKGFNIKMNNKIIVGAIFCIFAVDFSTGWQGHYMTVLRSSWTWHSYCTCWYWWWGCSHYGHYWRTYYYKEYQCQPGWTHNGDRNCEIPVCRPSCKNGGTCISPNRCKCPSTSTGEYSGCSQLTCSYRRPCYPGDCTSGTTCTCEDGFVLNSTENGCTNFDPSHTELQPVVGRSNVTLFHIRRTDNRLDYMFVLEGTNRSSDKLEIVWSNQKRFNRLRFEYESYFQQPQNLPERPNYVSDAAIGIVNSFIEVNVSKVPRQQSALMRDLGSFESYPCEGGFSANNPAAELATCTVDNDQFKTLIEHGDWLNVKFKTDSGGFQKLINLDNQGSYFGTKYFKGLQDVKEVQFQFDFDAPKHCSEPKVTEVCPTGSVMLRPEKEFTKEPIKTYWLGWIDDMSGVLGYYLEVFKLSPDPYNRLTEMTPLNPVFHSFITHSEKIQYPEYRPTEPGMYSVLLETRDFANNSRIARRFVLFDGVSEISLNNDTDSKLYVGSAVAETGHMWLTPSSGQDLEINVFWSNHFVNHIHDKNKLLNEILDYPIQFKEIQDDGILSSQKYVAAALDDNEGHRTKHAINNYHGIVKFEIGKEYTLSDDEPDRWETVDPLDEHQSFREKLQDGARMRIWIRATDIIGNTRTDSTLIRVDGTPPTVSRIDSKEHKVELNIENGAYNYTSRLLFAASDANSGVFKLSFSIMVSTQEKEGRLVYNGTSPAMTADMTSPFCVNVEGTCFVPSQQLDLDNCWFMTSKDELDKSTAVVNVTVYNQALLSASTQFNIGPINRLKGLEKYNGPENIRIESPSPNGFRVAWDLPETTSCYGRAEIVIVLLRRGLNGDTKIETYSTTGFTKYLDILGLDPSTEYKVEFAIKTSALQEDKKVLPAKTAEPIDPGASTDLIIGVVIGVLVIVVLAIVVVVVLIRKGIIQPPQPIQQISRAVTQRVRMTVRRRGAGDGQPSSKKGLAYGYDNRQSDLYIYGGMDMQASQIRHIDRKDLTLDTLIKSGHFANIYKARINGCKGWEIVAAKTLKAGFSPDDELAMKAKINFAGSKAGEHQNVIKFIGAVTNDDVMGPVIIYEYCEHGPLKDYLVEHRSNVTLDLIDSLFKFGLDIAKGMEYLASKQIIHRRLAARNILLTFLKEVKIAGFGPQPEDEEGGDAEQGKKERIPIKWMAPECMSSTKYATEKSDVWSYAVVLWEIFSLGETPYTGKARDLSAKLKKGERLSKPEQCDDTWYAVMKKCWAYDPKKRPTFAQIRSDLDGMFTSASGDEYYYSRR